MKRILLLATVGLLWLNSLSQNVFDPLDPQIRYNSAAVLGSAEKPDPAKLGLQKWVSTPTTGISTGGGAWDNSSYKAYYFNRAGTQVPFRVKFPKSFNNPDSANKKYPVALFFHGAGEFACPSNNGVYNNEKHLVHGGRTFRDRVDNGSFDGFLVYPQSVLPSSCWGDWGAPNSTKALTILNFIDSMVKYIRADEDRLFVYGLSAGGRMAWNFGLWHYNRVSTIAPSAGIPSITLDYPTFLHIPMWFASGGKDTNPAPANAAATYNSMRNRGADIKYTLYPTLGHSVWNQHWAEPGFVDFMNATHKANPLVYFQRTDFCPDSVISAKIGIVPGFHTYEWEKDGQIIASSVNGVRTVYDNSVVSLYSISNEITVSSFGTYRVRFKRTSTSEFSIWSPRPAVIKSKPVTQTPDIATEGIRSRVLPALDGSTNTPLTLPVGYDVYEWYRSTDNVLVSTSQTFNAGVGSYKARVKEQFGCGALFSPVFKVVAANGSPKPEAAKNLSAFAPNQTSIQLDWNENPNAGSNETGFEIYRSTKSGGPYEIIHITAPNVTTYTDANLPSGKKYFYIVRAVNDFGAAAKSNEASAETIADITAPSAPSGLMYRGSNQFGVSLSWKAATDNVGVIRYDIYGNDKKLYSSKTNSVTVFGLDSLTTYRFVVKAIDAAGNVSQPSNQVIGYTHRQGLNYRFYTGTYSNLPNFNNLTPVKTGITDTVNAALSYRTVTNNYALYLEGFIYVPVSGTYTFETYSDDGSRLYVNTPYTTQNNGSTVNNDGSHSPQYRTGNVTLTQGYNPIIITYFDATGTTDELQVWWSSTANGITRERIPKGFFTFVNPGTFPNPAAPSALAAVSGGYNKINLTWTDNSNNETGFEITRSGTSNGTFLPIATVAANTTSYTDSALAASTSFFYRLRSISATGGSAFVGTATAATAAAPAAPAVPTGLTATALGVDKVKIEFNDASNNETGFEIWRSVGNTSNFRKVTTLDAANGGLLSYEDNSLFANITYYYRVRSVGVVNSSAYTAIVSAKTLNTKPEVEQVLDFTMKFNTTFTLPIKATDIDGDALSFSAISLPTFGTLKNVSNGNLNIEFKPRISDLGAYLMSVIVNDGNGGLDTTYFTMVVDDNSVPMMNVIDNVQLTEGESLDVAVSASDAEGNDFLHWYYNNLPSFITFEDNGSGSGVIKFRPGFSSSGEYSVRLFVDDGFGAWTSQTFTITVIEKDPNEKVQVNFRYFTGDVPLWNDVLLSQSPLVSPPAPRINVTGLTNTLGNNSGIGLEMMSGTYTTAQNGAQTGNNTGVYPDKILRDQFHWGFFTNNNNSDTAVLKVKGLKPTHKYNLTFFSGINCTNCGTTTSTVRFRNGGQTAEIRYYLNTKVTDTLYSLAPDANGEILVTMTGDANTNLGGMLNALVIDAMFDDGSIPAKPIDLTGAYASLGVQLFWTDRSYNETNYRIYRATERQGPYTWVNQNMNLKDSISAVDNTVQPFTTYYYFLRGVNSVGEGNPSDTISVVTLNNNPSISGLNNLFVKTEGLVEDEFTVTDDPSETLTVTLENKPGFVTLVNSGNNNYKIVANPTTDDIGWYEITVKAVDDQGGSSSQKMTISVADKFTRSAYVKLGATGLTAPSPWNNWLGSRAAGSQILNIRDENNVVTAWDLRSVTKWTGVSDLGMLTGNNSGIYPDSVLQSNITLTASTPMQFSLLQLDPTKRYNISLVGSMNEGLEAKMAVNSGTENDTLEARYNTTTSANLNGLVPNASGQIDFFLTKLASSPVGYLSAIHVEEYDPAIVLMNPANLYAEPLSRSSVLVTWSDRSVNEDANTGFEIQRATDPQFTQNLTSVLVRSTQHAYTDNTVKANTRYWYRVRARSGGLLSEFSNKAKVVTPETIVSINFNYQVTNAAAPWNNMESNPDVLDPYTDLLDQSGVNTGMAVAIEKVFNGEFNAGKVTGNNSGVVPDNVLQANYWLDNTQISTMRVTGLNHSKRYRFGFIGSSSPNGWYKGNYTATYTIGERTVYLNSWENSTKIVYIGNVVPDMNGEVLVTFSTTEKANYGFNAGMIIMAYNDDDTTALVDGARRIMQAPIVQQAQESREISSLEVSARTYPNPFVEVINLDFYNNAASNNVTVDVVDIAGRLTYRRQLGQMPVGLNTIRLNTSGSLKNSGLYFVNLRINGKVVKSSKMVKTNK